MASDWEGVSIAPGYTMFEPEPAWTRLDDDPGFVAQIQIDRGRQDEFEQTSAGTAEIDLNDTGQLDQTITADLSGRPGAIAIRNPVTDEWFPLFRGSVDDYQYDLAGSQVVGRASLKLVDMQGYLEQFKLFATGGPPGDPPPAQSAGYIFYEDTVSDGFQTRIVQALTDAGIPSGLMSIFTGNINMQESVYSPGESILTVIIDAADAEFPTVANFYVDKRGIFQAHGRYARFDPDTVSASASNWEFNRWKAGDGAAIQLDSERAQIRPPYGYRRSPAFIRNHALSYPKPYPPVVPATNMTAQLKEDTTSRDTFGTYSWSAENLKLTEGTTTGNNANVECQLYAQYIVDNYAEPRNRIPQLTFRSLHPEDPRAAANWDLICRVDISDVIDVAIGHPGGGGFSEEFYVEGLHYLIRPLVKDLDTGYPAVTLTVDLSPAAYWSSNPFGAVPT
jgi:hypothetical protein